MLLIRVVLCLPECFGGQGEPGESLEFICPQAHMLLTEECRLGATLKACLLLTCLMSRLAGNPISCQGHLWQGVADSRLPYSWLCPDRKALPGFLPLTASLGLPSSQKRLFLLW